MDTINNIADQVRSAFPFDVTTEPLYTGDGMKTPYVGLIRSDTGEAASSHSVSRHYVPHTTDDVIALVEAASEASGNLRDEMTSLIDTFSIIAARWDDMAIAIQEMQQRQVRLNEFLVGMYGEPNENSRRAVTMHRNRTEAIMRRVIRERMQTGRPDLGRDYIVSGWEAFNAVQGYVQHDSRRHGNPSDIERAVMALNNTDVAKAERLAYEMAI